MVYKHTPRSTPRTLDIKGSGWGGEVLGGDVCSSMPANWRLIGVSNSVKESQRCVHIYEEKVFLYMYMYYDNA